MLKCCSSIRCSPPAIAPAKRRPILKQNGARTVQFVCLLACLAGIAQMHSQHPEIQIITAAVDPELNQFGLTIVPGLGDAGDRYFGTN